MSQRGPDNDELSAAKPKSELSLDALLALNREVIGLSRAGMPLGPGLERAALSLGGAGGSLARRLASAVESGRTFDEALETEADGLPPLYLALVRAGARVDRLPTGLEQFAEIAQDVSRLRRWVSVSLIYPLGVFLVAWGMAMVAAGEFLPQFDWVEEKPTFGGDTFQWWLFGPPQLSIVTPILVVISAVVLWGRSGKARGGLLSGAVSPERVPVIGRAYRHSAKACFAELLRVLLEHRTPLPDSLRLAADATGWGELKRTSAEVADEVTGGVQVWETSGFGRLPELVQLAFCAPTGPEAQSRTLAAAAAAYRRRADSWSDSVATYLPILATAAVGGLTVLAFGLFVLGPYFWTLLRLSQP